MAADQFEAGELADHGRDQIAERIEAVLLFAVLLADDVRGQHAHQEDRAPGHFVPAVGVHRGLDSLLRLPTLWDESFEVLMGRVAGCFPRREVRGWHSGGLLARVPAGRGTATCQQAKGLAHLDTSPASCGLVANAVSSGTPASVRRSSSAAQSPPRYRRRSIRACPSALT